METPTTKQEILEQAASVTVEINAPNRLSKLVAEKMMAGLDRDQAEQVARRQIARDAFVEQQEAKRLSTLMPTSPANVIARSRALRAEQTADNKEEGLAESGLSSNAAQVPQNNPPASTPVEVKAKEIKTAKA